MPHASRSPSFAALARACLLSAFESFSLAALLLAAPLAAQTTIGAGTTLTADEAGDIPGGAGTITFTGGGTLQTSGTFLVDRETAFGTGGGIIDVQSGFFTLDDSVSGSGSLIKTGAGTLSLGNGFGTAGDIASGFTGDIVLQSGTVSFNDTRSSGDITTAVGTTVRVTLFANDLGLTYAGNLSGAATLMVARSSLSSYTGQSLTLTGDNTNHTGSIIVTGATLRVGNGGTAGTLGTGDIVVNNGNTVLFPTEENPGAVIPATLEFNRSNAYAFSGNISGTGALVKNGAGTLTLSGDNTYTGGTTLNAGTLVMGSAGALFSGVETITLNGSATLDTQAWGLDFDRIASSSIGSTIVSDTVFTYSSDSSGKTINSNLTGSGSLVKNGAGTLTLSGDNTYTGGTTVLGGTLKLRAPPGDASIASGSTLNFHATSTIFATGSISGAGKVTKTNIGGLFLSGDNTYTGGSEISNGPVVLGHAHGLGSSGTVAIAADGTLNTGGYDFDLDRFKSSSSGTLIGSGGTWSYDSDSEVIRTINLELSGTAALHKSGTGGLNFNNSNSDWSGNITIDGGTVGMNNSNALGTGDIRLIGYTIEGSLPNLTFHNTGATLSLNSLTTLDAGRFNGLATGTITGSGTLVHNSSSNHEFHGQLTGGIRFVKEGSGQFTFVPSLFGHLVGTNSYTGGTEIREGTLRLAGRSLGSGLVTLSSGASLRFTLPESAVYTFANPISGGGTLDFDNYSNDSATVTLSGDNSDFTGATEINYGTLLLGHANALGAAGAISFTGAQSGADTAEGMIRYGTGVTTDLSSRIKNSDHAIRIDTNGHTITFATALASSNTGGLIKHGAGTLVLTTSDAYTGDTTVSGGTLALNRGSSDYNYSRTVNGSGTLAKQGSGRLTFTGDLDDFTGTLAIEQGTLRTTSASPIWLSTPFNVVIDSGATWETAHTTVLLIDHFSGAGRIYNATSASGGLLSLIDANDSDHVAGYDIVRASGRQTAVSKSGDGKLTVTGDWDLYYSPGGGDTIEFDLQTGTLQIGDGAAAGSITGDIDTAAGTSLIFNRSDNLSFNHAIAGAGALTKAGAGTLTLGGNTPYTGVTTLTAGTLIVDNGNAIANSAGVVFAGGHLSFGGSTSATLQNLTGTTAFDLGAVDLTLTLADGAYSGDITGAGSIAKGGAGTWTLTGDNTGFTGALKINAGWIETPSLAQFGIGSLTFGGGNLRLTDAGVSTYSNAVTLNADATLEIAGGDTLALASSLSGSGKLTKIGAGTLILSADNTYGATRVNAGTLQIGNGGDTGTLGTGDTSISPDTNLIFNRSTDYAYSAKLSSSGTITKLGDNVLTLSGANSLLGDFNLDAGTLALGSATALGANTALGTLHFGGGTLRWDDGINTDYSPKFSTASGQQYRFDTGGNNVSLVTALSSANSTLVKNGAGTLTLDGGAPSLTGTTAINAGTLRLGSGRTLGDSDISVAAGATFDIERGSSTSAFSFSLSGAGTLRKSGGGTVQLLQNGDGDLSGFTGDVVVSNGTLQIGNGQDITDFPVTGVAIASGASFGFRYSGTRTFAALISGDGDFFKTGGGKLILTGDNTWSGTTTIASGNDPDGSGTLQIGDGGAIGTLGSGNTTISGPNTKLVFNRSDTYTYAGDIDGPGSLVQAGSGTTRLTGNASHAGGTSVNAGTLQIGNGGEAGSLAGAIALAENTTLAFNRAGSLAFSGVISGEGRVTGAGPGTLTLVGDNTYTGGTLISGGTLALGHAHGAGATGTVEIAPGATFDIAGETFDLTRLAGSGAVTGSGTYTQGPTGDYTVTTALTGSASLSKTVGGVLTLAGPATYTGDTTLATGTLRIDNPNNSTFASTLDGAGDFAKTGAGTLTLSSTDNTGFTGDTTVTAGTLAIAAAATLGSGQTHIAAAATLRIANSDNLEISRLLGDGTVTRTTSGGYELTGNGDFTRNLVFAGDAHLRIAGDGTLTLTGANTYTGATTIDSGTLRIGDGGSLGGGGVTIASGALLAFNRSNDNSVSQAIGGAGALAKTGAGNLTLSGANNYTGGIAIDAGILTQGSSGALGSGSANLTVNANGTLDLGAHDLDLTRLASDPQATGLVTGHGSYLYSGDSTKTLDVHLSGAASLAKSGTGTLRLRNANLYTGGTTITAGTLALDGAGTLGTGTVTFAGGTLDARTTTTLANSAAFTSTAVIDTGSTLTWSGDLSGSGALAKTGVGALVLTGANTYAGGTTVTGGTLSVDTNARLGAGTTTVTLDGGTLATTGSINTTRTLALGDDDGALAPAADTNLLWNGVLTGVGALTKIGPGTLILNGGNDYTGGTTVAAGTLVAGSYNTNAFGTGAIQVTGGTLDLNGNAIANTLALHGGTLAGASTYTGTQTISGPVTFTGTIGGNLSVAAGGIADTTSATFTGATAVSSGGTLAGTGTVGTLALETGATLAPGNSPGTLHAGDTTWAGGSTYLWELADTTGLAGTGWDLLSISGALTLNASHANPITLSLVSLTADLLAGKSANFDGRLDYTFAFVTAETIDGFDADAFTFDFGGFTNVFAGQWSIANNATSLSLIYTGSAIPEPSTYAALLGALALALAVHRRSRRST